MYKYIYIYICVCVFRRDAHPSSFARQYHEFLMGYSLLSIFKQPRMLQRWAGAMSML